MPLDNKINYGGACTPSMNAHFLIWATYRCLAQEKHRTNNFWCYSNILNTLTIFAINIRENKKGTCSLIKLIKIMKAYLCSEEKKEVVEPNLPEGIESRQAIMFIIKAKNLI